MKNYKVKFGYSYTFEFNDLTDVITFINRLDATTSSYEIKIERNEITNGTENIEAVRTGLNDDYPNL